MTTLWEDIIRNTPKAVSNLVLAFVFWSMHYIVLIVVSPINAEQIFVLQTALIIISGIFLIRGLFNTLTIFDHLTKSLLKRLGIKEDWSRDRILKDMACIIAVLLVAAALYPVLNSVSHFEQALQQITTYFTVGLILLFVFDIGRTFYKISEKKANSLANQFSNLINEDEIINEK